MLLQESANLLLSHSLQLPDESEAAEALRAIGIEEPTGSDAVLLGQYLKAIHGDTAAAKFVRDAAAGDKDDADDLDADSRREITELSDEELYSILAAADSPSGRT